MSGSSKKKKRPPQRRPTGPSTSSGGTRGSSPARKGGDGPPVVGKRPSNPSLLLVIGIMWLAVAVVALAGLHRSWKVIPVVVFAGIGLLYLRGAAGSYLRRGAPKK